MRALLLSTSFAAMAGLVSPGSPVRAGTPAAPAAEQVQAQGAAYVRYYYKQPVPMLLDGSRIAVKCRDGAALRSLVRAVGAAERVALDPAKVESAVIPGWWFVALPQRVTQAKIEALVARFAALPQVEMASPVCFDDFGGPAWVSGDILVGFDGALPHEHRDKVIAEEGGAAVVGVVSVRDYTQGVDRIAPASKNGLEILAAANRLALRPDVVSGETDWAFTGRQSLIPNDPLFPTQWEHNNTGQSGGVPDQDMDAPEAWDITTGDPSIVVLVIDTGVQLDHPDLNMAPGADFTGSPVLAGAPGNACDNHGTVMAGCISGHINNGIGVTGVAPGCRVASARIFLTTVQVPCSGTTSTNATWTVDALNFAAASQHRVTSNSNAYGGQFAFIDTAYTNTRNSGIVHFASTGNQGFNSIAYPASSPSVNGVGAVDRFGDRASFSQYGPGTDFVAPGVAVSSTDRTGGDGYIAGDYYTASGTSQATAYAAGVAALALSFNSNLNANGLESIMRAAAVDRGVPGTDDEYGAGFVNAFATVLGTIPVPANNACASATDVTFGGSYNGTLQFASPDGTASCGSSSGNPDVWFQFTNTISTAMFLSLDTCGTQATSGVDTVLTVYTACGGAELACNDNAAGNGCGAADPLPAADARLNVQVSAGQTVLIRVSKRPESIAGPFVLNVIPAPLNDGCFLNVPPVSDGQTYLGTLVNATGGGITYSTPCGTTNNTPDVWYSFSNPAAYPVRLHASTCGTHDFDVQDTQADTVLTLHGLCQGVPLECNDNGAGECGSSDVGVVRDAYLSTVVPPSGSVLIRVAAANGSPITGFRLNIGVSPANDDCALATDVSAGGTFSGTAAGASIDGAAPGCVSFASTPDVWYTYTNPGPCAVTLTASTCGTHDGGGIDSGMDTVLSILAACGGTELDCNDDAFSGDPCGGLDDFIVRDSYVTASVDAGETVKIRVAPYPGTFAGNFVLNISAALPNDSCANALPIAAGAAVPFCTVGATTDGPPEAICTAFGYNNVESDIWYRYTATSSRPFTVETCGSSYDTKVALYPDSCPTVPGSAFACNDDWCGLQSVVGWTGVPGASYLIRVGGYFGAQGSGFLRVRLACAADFNGQDGVTVQDIYDFLGDWNSQVNGGPVIISSADYNGQNGITVQDIYDFLGEWNTGCP